VVNIPRTGSDERQAAKKAERARRVAERATLKARKRAEIDARKAARKEKRRQKFAWKNRVKVPWFPPKRASSRTETARDRSRRVQLQANPRNQQIRSRSRKTDDVELAKRRAGANKRKGTSRPAPYRGVTFHGRDGMYHAIMKLDGKLKYIGSYSTAKEAAKAWDAVVREANTTRKKQLPLNFPRPKSGEAQASKQQQRRGQYFGTMSRMTKKKGKQWFVGGYLPDERGERSKSRRLGRGTFDTEKEAADTGRWDAELLRLGLVADGFPGNGKMDRWNNTKLRDQARAAAAAARAAGGDPTGPVGGAGNAGGGGGFAAVDPEVAMDDALDDARATSRLARIVAAAALKSTDADECESVDGEEEGADPDDHDDGDDDGDDDDDAVDDEARRSAGEGDLIPDDDQDADEVVGRARVANEQYAPIKYDSVSGLNTGDRWSKSG
jgi:hypothetical protein